MSVVLLLLGVVTTLAGLLLAASGVSIRDGTFDTEVITPGTIATVGGLLLIGMGLAVRELQRIERALAAKPMPRATRAGESSATNTEDAPVRIPFPPKPKSNPEPVSADANPASTLSEDAAVERVRLKFPTAAPDESAPAVEEASGVVKKTAAVGRAGNGAAPARIVPRLDVRARPVPAPDKAKASGLASFLARGPRREAQTAAAELAVPTPPPAEPALAEAVADPSPTAARPAAISVLKSGVVEGMAYTLYSDGSVEAQLPQGTLRFGSITALRDHIESGA
ncbi:MAG: hypothetical protein P4L80_15940 [Xanthobacteraceae bacterium]|nr:hypothetical protein [Xanthobacteraceae bacterium]